MFSEPLMTSNRYPAERFGRAQNGPTFDRQNTIFAASKLLDEIASGRLNPNVWDNWGIKKHIRQNYFLVHIHFKIMILAKLKRPCFPEDQNSVKVLFIKQHNAFNFTGVISRFLF